MPLRRFLRLALAVVVCASSLVSPSALSQTAQTQAQPATAQDDLAARVAAIEKAFDEKRRETGVPGASLVVVAGDKVILLKGSGMRDAARSLPATPDTLFAIGSCTKAFTAMAAVMSQDDGKLSLDDSPKKYLPYFKLSDPDADARATLRDLLSHQTGLAGTDIAWYTGVLNREEVIRVAGRAKPTARLREKFQYQNVMYSAAGETVAHAQGTTWENLVSTRILKPLGMTKTVLTVREMQAASDYSLGYVYDAAAKQSHQVATRDLTNIAPAGAINSSAREMAEWLKFLVAGGVAANGKRLVSEKGFGEILTPQIKINDTTSYALGWGVAAFGGHKVYIHNGGIDGFGSQVAFLPQEKIGFAVLTNVEGTPLLSQMTRAVVTNLLGASPQTTSANTNAATIKPETATTIKPEDAVGRYDFTDAKMVITISAENGKLYMVAPGQPRYTLENVGGGRYRLAELEGFFVTFRPAKGNESETELYLEQPQGNYTLPKLKADAAPVAPSPATTAATQGSNIPLKELVGTYELQPGMNAEVSVKDGKVVITVPGQPDYPLVERERDVLYTPLLPDTYSMRVRRDAAGKVTGLLMKQPEGELELKRVGGASNDDKPPAPSATAATASNAPASNAPIAVEELRAKMIAAAGGEENLRKHKSLTTTASVVFANQGLEGEETSYTQAPAAYAREVTFVGLGKLIGTTREFFDGAAGGEETSFNAPTAPWGAQKLAEMRAASDFYALLDWQTLYKKVEVKAVEKEAGEDAYVVVYTPEKGLPATEYVSTKTFLVLRRDAFESSADGTDPNLVTARFADYRNVGGVLVPFIVNYDVPGTGAATARVREAKFDAPVPADAFRARLKK
jgi:CubicO group peptidase (beta-lactamase class C family)